WNRRHSIAAAIVLFASIGSPPLVLAHDGAVYKAKCAACHGPDGSGNTTVGKSLKLRPLGSPDVQQLTDAELTKVIADGKGKMPAYGKKLTPDEIQCLITLIRTMK
ncbi:MAG: hypothetical protein JWO56_596, partial [Acidobacteria bacterium]|nr:hypothetical protein [Acidobacteriota bacterium]